MQPLNSYPECFNGRGTKCYPLIRSLNVLMVEVLFVLRSYSDEEETKITKDMSNNIFVRRAINLTTASKLNIQVHIMPVVVSSTNQLQVGKCQPSFADTINTIVCYFDLCQLIGFFIP